MNNKKEIPIFFAVDDGYIPFLAVALQSLIENSSEEYNYLIKILNTDVKEENKKRIKKLEKSNINIEFVSVNNYIDRIKDKLYTRDYFSRTTYYRLFIPDLYPQYNKVLYLDSDIIILDDIANLYNIDIGDNLIGAIPDGIMQTMEVMQEYVEKVVGMASYKTYFNAGVILMNLDELRKLKFLEKFLYLLDKIKFSVAQDQDYLNRICKGRVRLIEENWNLMPVTLKSEEKDRDIKLIHYNFANKPWRSDEILYKDLFWKYAKETEVYDEIKQIKDNYTEEQKRGDIEINENLLKLAKFEAECVGDDRVSR